MSKDKALGKLIELCRKRLYSFEGEEDPCWEIFRYAIIEKNEEAWKALEELCRPLIHRWIRQEGPLEDFQDREEVSQEALFRFWRSYTPDKLPPDSNIREVLGYLKTCVVSAVSNKKRELRKRERMEIPWSERWEIRREPDHVPFEDSEQDLEATEVWRIIMSHCSDEREKRLARLTLIEGLKASEIVRLYPNEFPTVEEVYRLRRNLFKRLRRDPRLIRMAQKRL